VEKLGDRIVLAISSKVNALFNPGIQVGIEGANVQLQLKPINAAPPTPLTYNATGLPKGLTINQQTGVISGALDYQAGRKLAYVVKITASDGFNTSKPQAFRWLVKDVTKPKAYVPDQTYRVGQGVALDLHAIAHDASGDPLTVALSGKLPRGLRFDRTTGVISGILSKPGEVNLRMWVTDGIHVSSSLFSWLVNPASESDLAAPRVVGAHSYRKLSTDCRSNRSPINKQTFASTSPATWPGLFVSASRRLHSTSRLSQLKRRVAEFARTPIAHPSGGILANSVTPQPVFFSTPH
jgi:hypothetical protein